MSCFENARWIMAADAPQQVIDSYFDYTQTFCVSAKGSVKLYLAAHSQYAVYVNGSFVDCGQMPDSEARYLYDTLDISSFVQPGENRLFITQYVVGAQFSTVAVQIPGLIFALWEDDRCIGVSSEATLSGSNRKYLRKAEKMTTQMCFNFECDANGEETVFAPSVPVEKPGKLNPRPTKKMVIGAPQVARPKAQGVFLESDPTLPKSKRMQTAYLSAMTRKQIGYTGAAEPSYQLQRSSTVPAFDWTVPEGCRADGVYFLYDIGEDTVGFPEICVEVDEPTEILVGFGEHLDDMRVRTSCGYRHFCFRFVAKPGKNTFFHPFRRLGLRYMQLHIYSKTGRIHRVCIHPTRYPAPLKSVPVTDSLHKAIWDASLKTIYLCMQDHFCDCIWREQTMYPYDGRVEALYCYYGLAAPEFAREAIRICAETMRPDGLLEICAPGRDSVCMPNYSSPFIRAVMEYGQFTGDDTLAAEVFDTMRAIVEGYEKRLCDNGLIALYPGKEYWHFYEWVDGMDGKTIGAKTRIAAEENTFEAPFNAFIADAFNCFAVICEKTHPQLSSHYRQLFEKMRTAIHDCFYRPEFGGYLTRLSEDKPEHELTQTLMLHAGITPQHLRQSIIDLILRKQLIRTAFCYTTYTYEVLLDDPKNREFVIKDVEERWGRLVKLGFDTVWETERGPDDFGGAGALCQGASAAPVYVFGRLARENYF